ncbi:hypothetical protein ACHAXR_013187 [Thalassiosira sp. AJA248-18]
MKSFLPYVAVLLALFKANADPQSRTLRQSGGQLQDMISTMCPTFDCNTVYTDDCTFERPERPDMSGLTEDQISELKSEFRAKKEERRQKMLGCACCDGMSEEDILAAKGDGGSLSRPGGGGGPGRPGMGGGDGSVRPGMGEAGDGSSGRLGMGGGGGGGGGSGRPGMGDAGDGSSGRPGGAINIQEVLGEECGEFDCDTVEPESVDCTRFDSMSTNTRGSRRKNRLYCGCCRD